MFLSLLLACFVAFAAEKKTEVFTLDHQMSQACEKKIKENLRFEKGISKIETNLKGNTITITYDPAKTDTEKILQGFKKIGFNALAVLPGGANGCAVIPMPTPDANCVPDTNCTPEPVCAPEQECAPQPACCAPQSEQAAPACCKPGAECCKPGAACCQPQ